MHSKHQSMPFKKILEFHEQTLGKSENEKKSIAQKLSIDYNEYKRRIVGKEKEMEFFIIMNSLTSIAQITPIDESISQITGEYTSDFEVEFIDNYKMMVEVKHTDKDTYKISGGNLQKRIDYAIDHNSPLRFAISIKGFWGLFTSDYLKSKNGKIDISDFLSQDNWFDRELETCSYIFLKPLKIVSTYSKETTNGLGIFFHPYGELVSYKLYYANRLVFSVDNTDHSKFLHMIILETVQDRLANITQDISTYEKITTIVEYNNDSQYQYFAEYLFVLAIIKHMRYTDINSNDNMFITANDIGNILPIQYVRSIMLDLSNLGIDIFCIKDGIGYEFKQYCNIFWANKSIKRTKN